MSGLFFFLLLLIALGLIALPFCLGLAMWFPLMIPIIVVSILLSILAILLLLKNGEVS